MSVKQGDIRIYGSANMPYVDTGTVGGAIDTSVKMPFEDLTPSQDNALVIVSSSGTDTTQSIDCSGRTNAGVITGSTGLLTGTTPVSLSADLERLLIAVKSATTEGVVALYETATAFTGLVAAAADATGISDAYIQLDAATSGADDLYNGFVVRLTGGTGANQIAQSTDYVSSTNRLYVNTDWETTPSTDTEFLIAKGMVFDRQPSEILTVRRPFYNASASTTPKDYYEKGFIKNNNTTKALLNAVIIEAFDGTPADANVEFTVEDAVDDNGTSTNRITEPGGINEAFSDSNKTIPGANLDPSGAIGTWLHLDLDANANPANVTYTLQASGSTT
jgi:hypothetical protein